jgi:hypothetical protein
MTNLLREMDGQSNEKGRLERRIQDTIPTLRMK